MKTILILLSLAIFTSCKILSPLNKEKYDIIYRDKTFTEVDAIFENSIERDMPDTTISKVKKRLFRGNVCYFETDSRTAVPIPAKSKVKIVEANENKIIVELVDNKIKDRIPMILNKNGEFIISCDKDGTIEGTRYKVNNNNPIILFKNKEIRKK